MLHPFDPNTFPKCVMSADAQASIDAVRHRFPPDAPDVEGSIESKIAGALNADQPEAMPGGARLVGVVSFDLVPFVAMFDPPVNGAVNVTAVHFEAAKIYRFVGRECLRPTG